jgi:K+-transporting ATPase A subunit
MWLLPISVLLFSVAVAFPLGWYLARIMDGHYRAPQALNWCERRVNSGPQTWKQYAVALLVFNTVLYVFGYLILALQPLMPLNPRLLGALAPSTIFNRLSRLAPTLTFSTIPEMWPFRILVSCSFVCRCSFSRRPLDSAL